MSKSKPYEEQKTENQMASEASMMYETARSVDDFVEIGRASCRERV